MQERIVKRGKPKQKRVLSFDLTKVRKGRVSAASKGSKQIDRSAKRSFDSQEQATWDMPEWLSWLS